MLRGGFFVPKIMTGRPSTYSTEIAELICSLISEGQSLRKICALEDMPHMSTIMQWLAKSAKGESPYTPFHEQYACAREAQAEVLADEIIDIADDVTQDDLFTDEGKRCPNTEWITRSRLRVDARKWFAGKVSPKKYGDKQDLNITGKLETTPDEKLESRIDELLRKTGATGIAGGEGAPEKPEQA